VTRLRVPKPRPLRRGFCFLLILAFAGCARHEEAPPARAQRVITLAPNVTEMVAALGCASRIVATDDFSADVLHGRSLPHVGGVQPNLEKIVALRPDIVIANAAGLPPNLGRALRSVHIALVVVTNERLADIARSLTTIGTALHVDSAAAVSALDASLAKQRRTRPRAPRVMLAVWTDPLYVGGRNTFADDLFALCGARNAVDVTGWPQYSLESFVAAPPELLLYPKHSVSEAQVAALLKRAGTTNVATAAVDENLFTRPGPRVGEAAATLNAILDRRR
jgi:iron complex transport system substrate-binding protein